MIVILQTWLLFLVGCKACQGLCTCVHAISAIVQAVIPYKHIVMSDTLTYVDTYL